MLAVAEERGYRSVKKLLESAMAERFSYSSEFTPLRDAIKGRDVEAVDRLLKASPDLAKASDALGNGCIHWAVLTRQLNLIDRFLELGADIDARRADGQTPLLVSINGDYWYRWYRDLPEDAMKNTWVVSGFLLGKGATYDFCTACSLGDGEHVRKVLKQDPAAANRLNEHNQSPLYYAARYGRVQVCEMLLAHGANPNQPEDGATRGHALFEASALNHLPTAELLLKADADPNGHVDSSGNCITIVEDRHPETCGPMQELLRKHGAYTPVWNLTVEELKEKLRGESEALSDDFFHHVLAQDDPEIFDLFVEYCGDRLPTLAPTDVYGGNVPPPDQMQKLINHGIDPNRPNWIGRTFLHSCARKGAIDSASVLLENGAEIDSVDLEFGSTPLAEAVREGQTEMVKFLREQGADPDAPEKSTWGTARAVAKRKGDEEMARLLA
jgi:ankyrin repeat protein